MSSECLGYGRSDGQRFAGPSTVNRLAEPRYQEGRKHPAGNEAITHFY